MPFDPKLNQQLIEINKLIDESKITGSDGALEKFKNHVQDIYSIGRFSKENWSSNWRQNVYSFGTKFKERDPIDFLNILNDGKKGLNKDQREVLDFYISEIDGNSLPGETSTLRFEKLINEYPYNPEFRHTLGHFYSGNKNYKKAIEQHKFALNKDPNFHSFKKSLFNNYQRYLETFIDNSKYEEGRNLSQDLIKEGKFRGNPIMHNYLIAINERFKDYILLNEKIENAETTIKEIVSKEMLDSRNKIIEILGFFTAIIAFIFSTVSIGENFSFEEALIFNISLGLILAIFVLLMNISFSNKKFRIDGLRIPFLIVLIFTLLFIITKFGISIWL